MSLGVRIVVNARKGGHYGSNWLIKHLGTLPRSKDDGADTSTLIKRVIIACCWYKKKRPWWIELINQASWNAARTKDDGADTSITRKRVIFVCCRCKKKGQWWIVLINQALGNTARSKDDGADTSMDDGSTYAGFSVAVTRERRLCVCGKCRLIITWPVSSPSSSATHDRLSHWYPFVAEIHTY